MFQMNRTLCRLVIPSQSLQNRFLLNPLLLFTLCRTSRPRPGRSLGLAFDVRQMYLELFRLDMSPERSALFVLVIQPELASDVGARDFDDVRRSVDGPQEAVGISLVWVGFVPHVAAVMMIA